MDSRPCILCFQLCSKNPCPPKPESEPLVLTADHILSFCDLMGIPSDPFVSYFMDGSICFCVQCSGLLNNVQNLFDGIMAIRQQLNQIYKSTRIIFLSSDDEKSTSSKKASGYEAMTHFQHVRRKLKEDMNLNTSADGVDLNHIVTKLQFMMSLKHIEETAEKSPTVQALENTSSLDLYSEEDVKVFDTSALDSEDFSILGLPAEISGSARNSTFPTQDPSNLNSDLITNSSTSSDDIANYEVDSDWSPPDDAQVIANATLHSQKKKSPGKKKEIALKTERLHCTWKNCRMTFKLNEQIRLDTHIRKFHEGVKTPYLCHHCPRSFKEKSELDQHLARLSEARPFQCEHCGRNYKLKKELTRHIKIHTTQPRFSCTKCTRKFFDNHKLKVHLLEAHTGRRYLCELCSVSFCSNHFLILHQLRRHAEELNLEAYKCQTCNKIFSKLLYLKNHERLKAGRCAPAYTRKRPCSSKSKPTVNKRSKPKSSDTEKGKAPLRGAGSRGPLKVPRPKTEHICTICEFRFPNKLRLEKHMLTHNQQKDRPFKCPHENCGATFTYENALSNHSKVHAEKSFVCPKCSRKFVSEVTLKNHYRDLHSGLTPFECAMCGEKFNIKSKLTLHIRKVHLSQEAMDLKLDEHKINPI